MSGRCDLLHIMYLPVSTLHHAISRLVVLSTPRPVSTYVQPAITWQVHEPCLEAFGQLHVAPVGPTYKYPAALYLRPAFHSLKGPNLLLFSAQLSRFVTMAALDDEGPGHNSKHPVETQAEIDGSASPSVDAADASEAYRREFLSRFTAEDDRLIMRKVDWRFLPLTGFMYLIKQIDYTNAASIKVLQVGESRNVMTELGMTADQYNWVQTIYFVRLHLKTAPKDDAPKDEILLTGSHVGATRLPMSSSKSQAIWSLRSLRLASSRPASSSHGALYWHAMLPCRIRKASTLSAFS